MSNAPNAPSPAPQYQFAWTEASTVAALAGIVAVILTICTLIIDRIRRGREADRHHFATRQEEMGYFLVEKMGWWRAFWKKPTKAPRLTTVRGLIEAGDNNLWSSAAFDQLEPHHGAVSWVPIYSAIYSQIANNRVSRLEAKEDLDPYGKEYLERAEEDVKPRSIYSQIAKNWDSRSNSDEGIDLDTNKDLERGQEDVNSGRNNGELRRRLFDEGILVCCIRPLDEAQEKPKNGPVESNRQPPPKTPSWPLSRADESKNNDKVMSRERSLKNSEKLWMRSGKPCIEISREELLALSLTLGITLYMNDFTQNVRGLGPFGTGLNVVQDNGEWKLEMVHGTRLLRHEASRGSSYTSLFAKHIAFGSLPFAYIKDWVRSVYVNDGVLKAIKTGASITDGESFGGRPLQILKRLPGLKQIDAYYHWAAVNDLHLQPGFEHQLGRFYKTDQRTPITIRPHKKTARMASKSALPHPNPHLPRQRNTDNLLPNETPTEPPVPSTSSTSLNADQQEDSSNKSASLGKEEPIFADWARAVTGIAFGGLVPQSSKNLAEAVQFTVDEFHGPSNQQEEIENQKEAKKRKEVEKLINKIEELVNQIQVLDVFFNKGEPGNSDRPFGDYVAERALSEKDIDNIWYATPVKYHDTQEAAASFARYMNLLERMAAMFEPNDVRETANGNIPEKDKSLDQGSNAASGPNPAPTISAFWRTRPKKSLDKPKQMVETPDRSDKVDIIFEESCKYLQNVYVAAVKNHQQPTQNVAAHAERRQTSPSAHHPTSDKSLSEHMKTLSKTLSEKISEAREQVSQAQHKHSNAQKNLDGIPRFKTTLHDCVLIVRCILVIWANQVPKVDNADLIETDSELPVNAQLGGTERRVQARAPMTNHPASLMDLPQVMAFA